MNNVHWTTGGFIVVVVTYSMTTPGGDAGVEFEGMVSHGVHFTMNDVFKVDKKSGITDPRAPKYDSGRDDYSLKNNFAWSFIPEVSTYSRVSGQAFKADSTAKAAAFIFSAGALRGNDKNKDIELKFNPWANLSCFTKDYSTPISWVAQVDYYSLHFHPVEPPNTLPVAYGVYDHSEYVSFASYAEADAYRTSINMGSGVDSNPYAPWYLYGVRMPSFGDPYGGITQVGGTNIDTVCDHYDVMIEVYTYKKVNSFDVYPNKINPKHRIIVDAYDKDNNDAEEVDNYFYENQIESMDDFGTPDKTIAVTVSIDKNLHITGTPLPGIGGGELG